MHELKHKVFRGAENNFAFSSRPRHTAGAAMCAMSDIAFLPTNEAVGAIWGFFKRRQVCAGPWQVPGSRSKREQAVNCVLILDPGGVGAAGHLCIRSGLWSQLRGYRILAWFPCQAAKQMPCPCICSPTAWLGPASCATERPIVA